MWRIDLWYASCILAFFSLQVDIFWNVSSEVSTNGLIILIEHIYFSIYPYSACLLAFFYLPRGVHFCWFLYSGWRWRSPPWKICKIYWAYSQWRFKVTISFSAVVCWLFLLCNIVCNYVCMPMSCRYVHFDFHRVCGHIHFERLSQLYEQIKDYLKKHRYAASWCSIVILHPLNHQLHVKSACKNQLHRTWAQGAQGEKGVLTRTTNWTQTPIHASTKCWHVPIETETSRPWPEH